MVPHKAVLAQVAGQWGSRAEGGRAEKREAKMRESTVHKFKVALPISHLVHALRLSDESWGRQVNIAGCDPHSKRLIYLLRLHGCR
jgi:hypothetical protein